LPTSETQTPSLWRELYEEGRYRRVAQALIHRDALHDENLANYAQFWTREEQAVGDSLLRFLSRGMAEDLRAYDGVSLMGNSLNPLKAVRPIPRGEDLFRFQRKTGPKGPLAVFGYDYLEDHTKAAGVATPKLLSYEGWWGSGEEYAYEVLNFADGKRSAQEIRDAVSAEYGPVPLELVLEYLRALEKIGVVEQVK
jgi:aminopeptidase YwaD